MSRVRTSYKNIVKFSKITMIAATAMLLASQILAQDDTCPMVGQVAARIVQKRDAGGSETVELQAINGMFPGKSHDDRVARHYFKGLVQFVYGEGAGLSADQISAMAIDNCYKSNGY